MLLPFLPAFISGLIWLQAPGDVPVFGIETQVVRVQATVTDNKKRLVAGLAAKDFVVLEDGKPQEIVLFGQSDVPISFTLLMDTSTSMIGHSDVAQNAVLAFFDSLSKTDTARVFKFDTVPELVVDSTSDRSLLLGAFTELSRFGNLTALYDVLYEALIQSGTCLPEGADCRRSVILLTDGVDTASVRRAEEVIDRARLSDVVIYTIALFPREKLSDHSVLFARYFLNAVSEESGGKMFPVLSVRELKDVFQAIGQEVRNQYTLGYFSSNQLNDGKWRKIKVQIPGKKKINVRHRKGYYAGK